MVYSLSISIQTSATLGSSFHNLSLSAFPSSLYTYPSSHIYLYLLPTSWHVCSLLQNICLLLFPLLYILQTTPLSSSVACYNIYPLTPLLFLLSLLCASLLLLDCLLSPQISLNYQNILPYSLNPLLSPSCLSLLNNIPLLLVALLLSTYPLPLS